MVNFSDISRMTLFRGFSEDFVRLLDVFFNETHYNAGDVIIREGELQIKFFIIISGEVEIYRMIDGRKMQLDTLHAGNFFGEINLFDPGLATACVDCLTPVCTLEISNAQFRQFIIKRPDLAADFTFQLGVEMAKRFRQSHVKIVEELTSLENIRKAESIDINRSTV
jgi:CRP-like cAMP-binding protein